MYTAEKGQIEVSEAPRTSVIYASRLDERFLKVCVGWKRRSHGMIGCWKMVCVVVAVVHEDGICWQVWPVRVESAAAN
jgi:hypothetical protein